MLVRLSQQNLKDREIESFRQVVADVLSDSSNNANLGRLLQTLDFNLTDSAQLERFLVEIRGSVPGPVAAGQATCDFLLRKMIEMRASSLQKAGALRELWLPDVETLAQLTPEPCGDEERNQHVRTSSKRRG